MSTRLSKATAKTPRNLGKPAKIDSAKSKKEQLIISQDYDVGQPDLTTFFKKDQTTCSSPTDCQDEVVNDKKSPRDPEEKDENVSEKLVLPDTQKIDSTLDPENIDVKQCEKSSTKKTNKTSKIPRARFAGFSRLPLKNRAKKLAIPKICPAKSKSSIPCEPEKIERPLEPEEKSENTVENVEISDEKITLVVSDSKSIFSEEKCSGIEADVELDPDQELTTSTDNSPGRINRLENPPISSVLRASKLSCSCRSCTDELSELPGHRVNTEIWTDSRSSPDFGRYSGSGRHGLSKIRRLAESSKGRINRNETTEDSDIESSTDYGSYESDAVKRFKKRARHSSVIPDPIGIVSKTSNPSNSNSRIRSRSRMTFSFFDTLFDIVFWPFIFLRNDR